MTVDLVPAGITEKRPFLRSAKNPFSSKKHPKFAKRLIFILEKGRVAKSAGTGEPGSSIAKDLIDSEDPKHTLFCLETAFVLIFALFKG